MRDQCPWLWHWLQSRPGPYVPYCGFLLLLGAGQIFIIQSNRHRVFYRAATLATKQNNTAILFQCLLFTTQHLITENNLNQILYYVNWSERNVSALKHGMWALSWSGCLWWRWLNSSAQLFFIPSRLTLEATVTRYHLLRQHMVSQENIQ